jgi:octaprenyl-diphosphate synthase
MFRWCGRAAAHLADDQDALLRFAEFGDRFGVAFQMADDLKDLLGGDIGKNQYADIRNANPSYPLSVAMQSSSSVRDAFARAWAADGPMAPQQIEALGQMVIETGALAHTYQVLGEEIEAAVEALGHYRDRPGCAEMTAWATMMWRSFAMEKAV